MTTLTQLIASIEHDIEAVAGGVDGHVHDALTRHLTVVNVAGALADAAAQLAASPLAGVLEAALGLPPEAQGIAARLAGAVVAELGHQAQLQPTVSGTASTTGGGGGAA